MNPSPTGGGGGGVIWWRISNTVRLRARGCLRWGAPSEAEKFCIFATGIMQFGEYF